MRGSEWLCDRQQDNGCMVKAVVNRLCTAEGSDYALCAICRDRWMDMVRGRPELAVRCPRCAPNYLAHLGEGSAPGAGPAALARVTPRNEQVGPLYAAIDQAMFAEGVLVDVRKRVLDKLSSSEDFRRRNAAPLDDEVTALVAV